MGGSESQTMEPTTVGQFVPVRLIVNALRKSSGDRFG
jgi:hypothetical protein